MKFSIQSRNDELSNRLLLEAKDYLLDLASSLMKMSLILFYRLVAMGRCCTHSINIVID